jgi:choline dehydrogenase-like flavoprotein
MPLLGAALKNALRQEGEWGMSLYGFGETLPREDNRVSIDPELKDHLGIPALRIDVSWGENERAMLPDMASTAAEILDACGLRGVSSYVQDNPPGLTIHEMGGARMGRDAKTSVLNAWNQAHDARNLFVTDGACMVSSACQNPSLTYMALTARAADYAAKQLAVGAL